MLFHMIYDLEVITSFKGQRSHDLIVNSEKKVFVYAVTWGETMIKWTLISHFVQELNLVFEKRKCCSTSDIKLAMQNG